MKTLTEPANFDGAAFEAATGYMPTTKPGGRIVNCPDSMTQADVDAMTVDTAARDARAAEVQAAIDYLRTNWQSLPAPVKALATVVREMNRRLEG